MMHSWTEYDEGGFLLRKCILLLMAVVILFAQTGAFAQEGALRIAGFEGDSVNRDWSASLFFERWSDRFGLSLSFTQFSDYGEWQKEVSRYINGAELPDALIKAELSVSDTLALYHQGLIIDLKPWISRCMPNLSALFESHPEWEETVTLPGGGIAALPALSEIPTNNALWINRAWMDTLKMAMPTDIESFQRTLEAMKTRDPNRNGKQDEIPLAYLGMWDLKFLAHAYGLIANDYNLFVDDLGKVRHLAYEPAFREFITWLRELYLLGLIDPEGFQTSDAVRQVTDANATVVYGMLFGSSPLNLMPQSDISAYEILMPLTYQDKRIYRDLTGCVARGAFAVTSACRDPEALLRAVDYLYGDDGAMLVQAGLEGVEYSVDEDGAWMWIEDANADMTALIRRATIADGGAFPYFQGADVMLRFGDATARAQLEQMLALSQVSVMPYPLVMLDSAAQSRVDELQMTLGALFETHMGRFILGHSVLDDAGWQSFLDALDANGLDELIDLFQAALGRSEP